MKRAKKKKLSNMKKAPYRRKGGGQAKKGNFGIRVD